MIILQLNACPAGVRGDVTKWLMEISTGVYVGQLTARSRDALWNRICKHAGAGSAVMVFSAHNEQGFRYYVHNSMWQPIDFEGISLMRRPLPSGRNGVKRLESDENKGIIAEAGNGANVNHSHENITEGDGQKKDRTRNAAPKVPKARDKTLHKEEAATSSEIINTSCEAISENSSEKIASQHKESNRKHRASTPLPYIPWPEGEPLPSSFTVLDTETTGLNPDTDRIIEIACIRVRDGIITDEFQTLVDCEMELPENIKVLTGLSDEEIEQDGINLLAAVTSFLDFLGDDCIIGHNAAFDIHFILSACRNLGLSPPEFQAVDTVSLSRRLLTDSVANFRLETIARHLGVSDKQSHRALPDARITTDVYLKLKDFY